MIYKVVNKKDLNNSMLNALDKISEQVKIKFPHLDVYIASIIEYIFARGPWAGYERDKVRDEILDELKGDDTSNLLTWCNERAIEREYIYEVVSVKPTPKKDSTIIRITKDKKKLQGEASMDKKSKNKATILPPEPIHVLDPLTREEIEDHYQHLLEIGRPKEEALKEEEELLRRFNYI